MEERKKIGKDSAAETGVPQETPEPPKLSPSEEADILAKRGVFRKMVEHFNDDEVNMVEGDFGSVLALITTKFDEMGAKVTIKELGIDLSSMKEGKEEIESILAILADTTVTDASNFLTGAANAVRYEVRQRSNGVKVKDLEIKFL